MIRFIMVIMFSLISFWGSGCKLERNCYERYHQYPEYYNYENDNIVIPEMPRLNAKKYVCVDVNKLSSSELIPLGANASSMIDSLLFDYIFKEQRNLMCAVSLSETENNSYMLCPYRVFLHKGVDSYLVLAHANESCPILFLVNLVNSRLKSVLLVSAYNRQIGIGHKYAKISGGHIDLFEDSGQRLFSKPYYSDNHLVKYKVEDNGTLKVVKNYSLLYHAEPLFCHRELNSGGVLEVVNNEEEEAYYTRKEIEEKTDTIQIENYRDVIINLSELPKIKRRGFLGSYRPDVRDVRVTPTCCLGDSIKSELGPKLCRENWTSYDYYWLNQAYEHKSVKTYFVFLTSIGLHRSMIYMINIKDNYLLSVVRVSSCENVSYGALSRYTIILKDSMKVIDYYKSRDRVKKVVKLRVTGDGTVSQE